METSLPRDSLFKDLLKQINSTNLFQTVSPCPLLTYNSSTTPSNQNCSLEDVRLLESIYEERLPIAPSSALSFFIYFTPVIFLIGIVGNILCLVVFLSKNMRKLSASIYLAALSTSDLMALLFYVLPEWLKYVYHSSITGQNTVIFLEQPGTCQVMLYLAYIARFLSSWIVVFFTIERFIGVCYPLKRRDICDPKSSSRVVVGAIVVASTACVFKPILSASHTAINGDPVCTRSREHLFLSFILDGIFGVTITFIPFVLITVLNLLIIRKLVIRNKRYRKIRIVTEESIIRLEFTFILLAISICFVSLNLPYFAVWCKMNWIYKEMFTTTDFSHSDSNRMDDLGEVLHVTRTIFFINYCINFFLYSITGAYFRKELKHLFLHKDRDYKNSHHCSAYFSRTNSRSTPQSWV